VQVTATRCNPAWALPLLALPLLSCSGDGIRKAGADDRITLSSSGVGSGASVDAAVTTTMAVATTAPAAPVAPAACPAGMTLVEGDYCTDVEHHCKKWLDPSGRYHLFRCAAYDQPAKCKGSKVSMRYCIDIDEQKLDPKRITDDKRPDNRVSFIEAKASCEQRGAHLCSNEQWQFACEGEEMRPYPYGFVRDPKACNIDRDELGKGVGRLHDFRTAQGENAQCVSPFGVRDMAGNLEEWAIAKPNTHTHSTVLKGSWWLPGRSTCRATNAGHDAVYEGTETGFRCCY
jgi:formylglycine-generating enzyme